MSYKLCEQEFNKLQEFINRQCAIYLDDKYCERLSLYTSQRFNELNISNFSDYFFQLRFDTTHEELQKLINAITINDTYFDREKKQFEIMVKNILPELYKTRSQKQAIRILSAPCSSGEEVYSIMMHILNTQDLDPDTEIEILGIDIDTEMIQKAKRGMYDLRSLKLLTTQERKKYFTSCKEEFQISKQLMDRVTFKNINVRDTQKMEELGKFDLIFSRNMFIYFDELSRKDIAMTFYNMLNDNGYIFLGHTEQMSRIVSSFEAIELENTLVYKKL